MRIRSLRQLLGVILVSLVLAESPAGAQTPPKSGGPVDPAVIGDLVAASRILAAEGVLDAFGHVSVRHPADPNRFLIARALAPALVTAGDIMEFDLDSNPVDQRARSMFLERFIHGAVYKVRPDAQAVVHSHSPTVVPFSISSVPMRPVFHVSSFLYVGVPVYEIRDVDPASDMLVRNNRFADALAKTLADKPVALMRGHGNVVVGRSIPEATTRAIYTEVNARLQATAIALGGTVNYLSREEGEARQRAVGDPGRAWNLWKTKAMGK